MAALGCVLACETCGAIYNFFENYKILNLRNLKKNNQKNPPPHSRL